MRKEVKKYCFADPAVQKVGFMVWDQLGQQWKVIEEHDDTFVLESIP